MTTQTESLQNLSVEREEIIAQLNADEIPADAQQIVDRADQIIAAEEQRIAALKERRDEINDRFAIKRREQEADRQAELEREYAAVVAAVHASEDQRLRGVYKMEQGMAMVEEGWREARDGAEGVRSAGRQLVHMRGISRVSLHGLDLREFVKRSAARIAAVIHGWPEAEVIRFGGLDWQNAAWTLYREPGWAEQEARVSVSDIATLTGGQ